MNDTINIEELEPREKIYKVGFGKSLFMNVMPNGGKYWRYNYRFNDRQKTLALGTYPEISQQKAIEERDKARELLKQGIDPAKIKRAAQNERIMEARNPRPQSIEKKAGFHLSMPDEETFIIENNGQALNLSRKQAVAVFTFLDSTLEAKQ